MSDIRKALTEFGTDR